jgi:cytochrome P450
MDIAPPTDPLAAVSHPDPYAYYAELATAERPERDDRLGLWIVANPTHVAQLLRHPDARVVPPAGAPRGFAEYARFNEGERHARLRAEVIERMATVSLDEPAIALDDLDAFVENYALYALVRDLRSNVKGDILFQSCDAVRALIGNALVAFERDPSLGVESAVARALAHDPPVHNTRREMAADVEIGGATLRAGDTALVVLVTMTFGTGPHACPGDSLATRIATMALQRLLGAGFHPRKPVGYLPRPNVRIPLFDASGGTSLPPT